MFSMLLHIFIYYVMPIVKISLFNTVMCVVRSKVLGQ